MAVFTAAITFITLVRDTSMAILLEIAEGDGMAMGFHNGQMTSVNPP
jgi:hypothetical protein